MAHDDGMIIIILIHILIKCNGKTPSVVHYVCDYTLTVK